MWTRSKSGTSRKCAYETKYIKHYDCVFIALVIRRANRFCAALYCHLWPVWLYHNFTHYLKKSTIFGTNVLNVKRGSCLSIKLTCERFFIPRRTQRSIISYFYKYSCKYQLISSHFNQTWIPKIVNTKFHGNPFNGNRSFTRGQRDALTDWHDETSGSFPQFCEFA